MGLFSVHFSTEINGKRHQYPHNLRGQASATSTTMRTVTGVDRGAVEALRSGQRANGDIVMTKDVAKQIAKEVTDGARISAYEKPVYYAAIAAAKGEDVKVTDASGHWRKFTATKSGAAELFKDLKGTKIA